MSGLRRAFSHPDRANDPHARAHRLVSDRFLAPLAGPDEEWLATHLDACDVCRQMAADWAADRGSLRALAEAMPIPPRNLGARLAAALDVEEARARRSGFATDTAARRPGARPSRLPAVAMALVAVAASLALVILPVLAPFAGNPFGPGRPAATPILVAGAPVAWAHSDPDGRYVVQAAVVDRVCPRGQQAACGTIDQGARPVVTLDLQPTQVILPPTGDRGVAVGETGIYTFVVPEPEESVTPAPPASSETPTRALPTPAATEVPASPPADTPAPSESFPATSAGPSPSVAGPPSPAPESPAPGSPAPESAAPGSPEATPPLPSVATLPPSTPAPVAATALAIVEDVVLVGAAPAYSADGQWLAFSARPIDGEAGPDIYAWRAGDERARRLTSTGASVFAGWLGDRILGSTVSVVTSPGGSPEPAGSAGAGGEDGTPAAGSSNAADGASPAATPAARPSVEPSPAAPSATIEGAAGPASPEPPATPEPGESGAPVAGPGSSGTPVEPSPTAAAPSPSGPSSEAPSKAPGETPVPTSAPSPSPAPPEEPSASPQPRAVAFSFLLDPVSGELENLPRPGIWRPVVDPSGTTVVYFTGRFAWSEEERSWVPASGTLVVADWADVVDPERPLGSSALPGAGGRAAKIRDWNVRWAESGDHLAVWLADSDSSTTGRLSLYATDELGRPVDTLLDATAALPVFSIDASRLVWATPRGDDGEGSRIGVFAWDGAAPGAVFSAPQPGEGLVVVR